MPNSNGFTLIELLLVIAIIAVLSVAVILTLNPAEILRQSRDATRISDLTILKKTISLYLTDAPSPSLTFASGSHVCGISVATNTANPQMPCAGRYVLPGAPGALVTTSSVGGGNGVFTVDGAGWVPVNLKGISSGAPISHLPRDPINSPGGSTSTNLFYTYAASSTSKFELDAKMESLKYGFGGVSDAESKDGGDQNRIYEVGSGLSL